MTDERQAEVTLATACAAGDSHACAELDARHLVRVPSYVAHLRKPAAFVDDIVQRVREKLLVARDGRPPRIAEFDGRAPLDAWIRVIAVRTALDLVEGERRHEVHADAPDDEAIVAGEDPDLVYLRQRYLPHFREAFAEAMKALTAEERTILRFYLLDGLNIDQIGKLIGKSRATVGRLMVACREKLLAETCQRLTATAGATETEAASLARALQSRLDLSIRGFLATAGG